MRHPTRRYAGHWILAAAALFVIAACSKDKDIDKPAVLVQLRHPALKIQRVWKQKVPDKGADVLRLDLGLALEGDRLYAAGRKGEVIAFDATTGRVKWRTKTKVALSGGTAVAGDMLAVGSSDGDVFALNATTGAVLWHVRLNGEILAQPAISERVVAVRTVDGKLHGLAPQDGHEVWSQEEQTPRLSLRGTAQPVIVGDLTLSGFDNGKVMAVNMNDGSMQWEATIAPSHGKNDLERLDDVDAAVRVSGQDVYAVGFQGRIAMLALENGQIWWQHDASSYRALGIDEDALYMATADGQVVAMRRHTGVEVWRQRALLHRALSSITPADNTLIVGDLQGYVHWLDKSNGDEIARVRDGKARISTPPVVAGNMVYVVNDAGRIAAYRVTPIPGARQPSPLPAAPDEKKQIPETPPVTPQAK